MPEPSSPPTGRRRRGSDQGLDERQLRFERGIAAILLFGGYVWGRDLVIPLVAIGITIALVPVGVRPFGVPFEQLIASRIRAPRHWVPFRLARADDLTLAALLALATLFILVDINAIARVISLGVALTTTFEAAAGLWVGAPLANKLRSRSTPRSRSQRRD